MDEVKEALQALSEIPAESEFHAVESYKQHIIALFSHFKSQVDNLEYDLNVLFNEENGIIIVLQKLLRKPKFRTHVSYAFNEILDTILKSHIKRIADASEKHEMSIIERIKKLCVMCVEENIQLSDTKETALKILILCVNDSSASRKIFYEELENLLVSWINSKSKFCNTVLKQVYILLGHLGNSYVDVFIKRPQRYFDEFVHVIEEAKIKLDNDTAGVSALIEGCFDGLTMYMRTLEIPAQSFKGGERLYKVTKEVCEFDETRNRKSYQRAALNLVTKHCKLLKTFILSDYKWWYQNLLNWLTSNSNKDNQKAVVDAMKAVCTVIAQEIMENQLDNGREIVQYFNGVIKRRNESGQSIYSNTDLSIMLLGIFVGPSQKYCMKEDISRLFTDIVERVQCLYSEKHESEADRSAMMERVAEYLDCLAKIVCNPEDIPHQQLLALETLTIMIMKMYPDFIGTNFKAKEAIEKTVLCLSLKPEKTLDSFLEVVVFQGIIRTCDNLILQDVELHKSVNIEAASFKDYLPMWESLFKLSRKNYIEEPYVSESEAWRIKKLLYKRLIDSALLIIDRLDLSTTRKEDDENLPVMNDVKCNYNAKKPKDFTMLVNLMDLLKELFPKLNKTLFLEHLPRFGRKIIDFSVRYPLVSSFYRIIATALQISDEKGYFKVDGSNDAVEDENFRLLIQSYLELVLNRALQFTDELQIACLHVIMAAPTTFIEPILELISTFLKVAFRVGSSYLPLADTALTTIERWIDAFSPEKINPFLRNILPCLDSFLRSRDYEADPEVANSLEAELKVLTSGSKKSKRKIKKIHERPDTELFRLQRRIVLLLSKLDMSTALTILNEDNGHTKWQSTKQLKFTIPFPDCKLDLYLDEMLPRIVESALSSSDRKTKVAASELLHAIVLVLLGNDRQSATLESNQTANVLKELMPALLRLGSDSDEAVRTLFKSLVMPMIFYFSSKFQAETKSVKVVFEALMDGITNPTDTAVRDFSAECIKVFTEGSIQQSANRKEKVPLYIKGIVARINLYCVHPCKFKRLGGAMIFNSIYPLLRKEKPIVNEHWLELMYYLIKNLSLSEENNDCSDQLKSALKHILRVINHEDFRKLLNARNPNRKQPIEFEDETLRGATLWLLKQTSSSSVACRSEAMVLFKDFATFLPGCAAASNYVNSLISKEGVHFISNLSQENLTAEPSRDSHSPYKGVIAWLKNLHAALDFYSWLIRDIMSDPAMLLRPGSKFMKALEYFIRRVGSTSLQHLIESLYDDWCTEVPQLESSLYSNIATEVLTQLFKFLTVCHLSLREPFFREILNDPLWKLITLCILKPSATVIRGVCSEASLDFKKVVANMLHNLNKDLPPSMLTNLQNIISTEISIIHGNLMEKPLHHLLLEQGSNNEVAEGLVLLQELKSDSNRSETFLKKVSKMKTFNAVFLYRKIFDSLFDENNVTVQRSEKDSDVLRTLFTLGTLLDDTIEILFSYISNVEETKLKESLRPVLKGDHFTCLFFDQIVRYLSCSLSKAIDYLITPDKIYVDILLAILKEHEYSPANLRRNSEELQRCIFQKWDLLEQYAEKYNDETAKITNVFNILMGVVKTFRNRVGCFRSPKSLGAVCWLMGLLGKSKSDDIKFGALDFLVAVFAEGSKKDATYDNITETAVHAYSTEISLFVLSDSIYNKSHLSIKISLNKLLTGLEQTGNCFLLTRIMMRTSSDLNPEFKNDVKKTLSALVKKKSNIVKIDLLKTMYNCVDQELKSPEHRANALNMYLEPTLRYCCIKSGKIVLKAFYEDRIEASVKILKRSFSATDGAFTIGNELVSKIVALTLFEIMFGYFNRSEFDNDWFKAASSYKKSQEFLQVLLTLCKEPVEYNETPESQEQRNLRRQYYCECFNATMALICNSKRDVPGEASNPSGQATTSANKKDPVTFFENFIFKKLNLKEHMEKIINLNRTYQFNVDFNSDELPQQRKTLVSIRRAARAEAGRNNFQESLDLTSQSLFEGSLSEDLTNYDLSNHKIVEVYAPEESPDVMVAGDMIETECLELEIDAVNEHECMPMLTAVINTMVDCKIIVPPPKDSGTPKLPLWMSHINNALRNSTFHKNIRLFLCKLILNVSDVFKPYASYFIPSISQTIAQKCFGNEINYFVADLVTLMLSWRTVAVPNGDKPEDKSNASDLLLFLMQNTDSFNRKVFRRNLELVKTVVEVWQSSLDVPYQLLYESLKPRDLDPKSTSSETGIMLAGILVVHNIAPYTSTSKIEYLQALLKNLKSEKSVIYEPTAEVIGRILVFLSKDNSDSGFSGEDLKFYDNLKALLQSFFKPTNDKFYRCLLKISLSYSKIVENSTRRLMVYYNKISAGLQEKCLDLLQISVVDSTSDLCTHFPETQVLDLWMSYISTSGSHCHLPALKLFSKLLKYNLLSVELQKEIIFKFHNVLVSRANRKESRKIIYETVIDLYKRYLDNPAIENDVKNKCKEILVLGLVDKDAGVQKMLYEFWIKKAELPEKSVDRLKFVISNMYVRDIEYAFLGYCLRFVLECAERTPGFHEKIFNYALGDCDWKDLPINAAWKRQHASFVPLFADATQRYSLSSSIGDASILRGSGSVEFSPTVSTAGTSLDVVDSSVANSSLNETGVPSSFDFVTTSKFKSRSFANKYRKPQLSMEAANLGHVISSQHKSSRLRKNRTTDDDNRYAKRNLQLNAAIEISQKEEIEKRKKDVTVLRKYKTGAFPDIEIDYKDLIEPLRVFVQRDQTSARHLMVALFKSFLNEESLEEADDFYHEVSTSIVNILQNSLSFNSAVIGSFLEISYYCHEKIDLDFDIASTAAQASGLLSLGTLVLENQLSNLNRDSVNFGPPSSKRQRLEGSDGTDRLNQTDVWFKLAELYYSLGESDVVLGIFRDKLTENNPNLISATEKEQLEDWQSARKYYLKVYMEHTYSEKQRQFVEQSFFKATANCSNWDQLNQSVLATLNENYDELWDGNKKLWNLENIAPWLFSSELHILLRTGQSHEFPKKIKEWISEPGKKDELMNYVGEQLAVWGAVGSNGSREEGNKLAKNYLSHLLNDWASLNPLSHQLRTRKLLDFQQLSDIMNMLSAADPSKWNNQENKIESLQRDWKKNPPVGSDSLTHWDTRLLYRCLIFDRLWQGLDRRLETGVSNSLKDTRLRLIDATLTGKNSPFAKHQLQLIGRLPEAVCSVYLSKIKLKESQFCAPENKVAANLIKSWEHLDLQKHQDVDDSLRLKRFSLMADIVSNFTEVMLLNISADARNKFQKCVEAEFIKKNLLFSDPLKNNLKKLGFMYLTDALELAGKSEDASRNVSLAEAHMKIVRYCFGVYDKQEEGVPEYYEEHFIRSLLSAMRYGSVEAMQLFPCLLQLPSLEAPEKSRLFKEQCDLIPEWKFLEWVPQLLTALFTPKVAAVSDLLVKLAETYPKALIYPFRLSCEMHTDISPATHATVLRLRSLLDCDVATKTFLEAVSCVCMPIIKLRWFLNRIVTSLETKDSKVNVYIDALQDIFDVTELQGEMIKTISDFKKDAAHLKKLIDKGNMEGALKLSKIFFQSDKRKAPLKGSENRLKSYCPWLASFISNRHSDTIELPGQYSSKVRPDLKNHVMIAGFKTEVDVMTSLRQPIKLTVIGNDGNEYIFLVKCGEDLRQDQRIQQLLTLMNSTLASNSRTLARKLSVATYAVIPLSSSVGLIQWVNDTQSLKDLMTKHHSKDDKSKYSKDILNHYAAWLAKSWKKNATGPSRPVFDYGNAAMKYSRQVVVDMYDEHVSKLFKVNLRESLMSKSLNLEAFISKRNEFLSSYAVMSICHWLLGIGDRHLSNTLVNIFSGRCLGIDFGHAFGSATQMLPVPELMPFRLTPQILQLTEPFEKFGLFRETMVSTLKCQQDNHHILLATMQVFIEEPSMDWYENAHKLAKSQLDVNEDQIDLNKSEDARESFCTRNIEFARKKLKGGHPTDIMVKELEAGHSGHPKSQFLNAYKAVLQGTSESVRAKFRADRPLNVNQQVDILLDQAEDKHILGLTWVGWEPWV